MIGAVLLISAVAQTPVPPPLEQASADCARPTYAVDQLVCRSSRLRALDRRLAEAWDRILPSAIAGPLIEDQASWFRRSRLCAFYGDTAACVAGAYRERLAVLSGLGSLPAPRGSCALRDGRTAEMSSTEAVTMLVDRRVVAVAVPRSPAWRAFITAEEGARSLVLRDLRGRVVA